jgi:hypothetical protein
MEEISCTIKEDPGLNRQRMPIKDVSNFGYTDLFYSPIEYLEDEEGLLFYLDDGIEIRGALIEAYNQCKDRCEQHDFFYRKLIGNLLGNCRFSVWDLDELPLQTPLMRLPDSKPGKTILKAAVTNNQGYLIDFEAAYQCNLEWQKTPAQELLFRGYIQFFLVKDRKSPF